MLCPCNYQRNENSLKRRSKIKSSRQQAGQAITHQLAGDSASGIGAWNLSEIKNLAYRNEINDTDMNYVYNHLFFLETLNMLYV